MTTREQKTGQAGSPAQRNEYDAAREECPVQRIGQCVMVYGHDEVREVVTRPDLYSSAVSRYLQLPNGLDGAEHAMWRALIDPFLNDPATLARVEQIARQVMAELLGELQLPSMVDAVADLGARYAVRVQLQWLGWAPELEERLLEWINANRRASRSGDQEQTARVARDFDVIIRGELERHRTQVLDDPTDRLLNAQIDGRPLQDEELVSVLRNWTAGDLSSLALCVGVILQFLATHQDLQFRLRNGVSVHEMNASLDEILRIDDPFVANRRVVKNATDLAGVTLEAGDVVQVNWTAANRDPRQFSEPDKFDPEWNSSANLVYGTGPHACPGRALSTLELRVFIEELLKVTSGISLAGSSERELFPAGGYAVLPITLERR